MVEVVLAIAAIAVTAAIVLGDARPAQRRERPRPHEPTVEHATPLPLPLSIENIDAPTQAMDAGALAAATHPQTTFALPLPSAQTLPETHAPIGTPHFRPDPDRFIQTEVLVPEGNAEHARAVTRLVIGIAGAGLALGLIAMGLGRAIGFFFHAL